LLIEEGRQNYLFQSEDFSSWWVASAGVVSRNKETTIPDPAGTFNGTRVEINATFSIYRDPISSVPDGTRAISIFARAVTGGLNLIRLAGTNATVVINLETGATVANSGIVAGSLKVERFGGIGADGFNWWRISYATTNTTLEGLYIENGGTVSGAITAFLIWGAQFEVGSFATSYIPTTTGTLARGADVCSITGGDFNNFYNQSEGTLFLNAVPPFESQLAYPLMVNTTGNSQAHRIARSNEFGAGSKRWVALTTTNAGLEGAIFTSGSITTTNVKAAYAFKLNDNAFAVNNVFVGTDTTVTMPNPTSMRIGGNDGANVLNGHIAAARFYKKRLPNAKLQALTV
jgi:hypothetical protein